MTADAGRAPTELGVSAGTSLLTSTAVEVSCCQGAAGDGIVAVTVERTDGGLTAVTFDVDAFLSRPLTARIATNGPTVRPAWFLWEEHAFWILTGPWAKLLSRVRVDPALALVVDECDLTTGVVRQVIARGRAEVLPFDVPRGYRKLSRYLGVDETHWDQRFRRYLRDDPGDRGTVWLRLRPDFLTVKDLSYNV